MAEFLVGTTEEIPEGSRKIIEVGDRSIVVFNVASTYVAVRNWCPHHGAPIGRGVVGNTLVPSEPHELEVDKSTQVVSCPWHHWEFDLSTRRCLTDSRMALRNFLVSVRDNQVFVHVGRDSKGKDQENGA